MARAYRMLDEAGIISTQHGRGTFLLEKSEQTPEKLRQQALDDPTRHYLAEANQLAFFP